MIVFRFRAVGLVAGVATAALGCYLMTQRVASERQALARVEHKILLSRREIRQLATEIETRSRMSQLERWNQDVLALGAARPGQYVAGEVQLASFNHADMPATDPEARPPASAVRQVAYRPPATDTAAATRPRRSEPQRDGGVQEQRSRDETRSNGASSEPVLRHANYVRARNASMTMMPEKISLNSSDFAADLATLAAREASPKRAR